MIDRIKYPTQMGMNACGCCKLTSFFELPNGTSNFKYYWYCLNCVLLFCFVGIEKGSQIQSTLRLFKKQGEYSKYFFDVSFFYVNI